MPNYSVLVDERDRPEGHTTYVIEDNIGKVFEPPEVVQLVNRRVWDYFISFDASTGKYTPNGELARTYPVDHMRGDD